MRFFAAIRYILARIDGPDVLNALAHQMLKEHILPPIEEEAESEGLDGMEAREILEIYEPYLDERSSRGQLFGVQAFKVIKTVSQRYNIDDSGLDDLIMQFVQDVYSRRSWKDYRTPEKGPENFASWFTGIARLDAMSNARNMSTREKREVRPSPRDDDEGDDPMERMEDPSQKRPGSEMEMLSEKEVMRNLRRFVNSKLRGETQLAIFDAWMKELVKKDFRKVNLRSDVLKPLAESLGLREPTLYQYSRDVKKAIAQFFAKEYQRTVRAGIKFASVEDSVAYVEYVRRMAAWVLPQNPIQRMLLLR